MYLDITYEDYQDQYGPYIIVLAENFCFKDNGVNDGSGSYHINEYTIYPGQYIERYPNGISWTPGISIFLSGWNSTLSEYNICVSSDAVYFDEYKFVREQGTKNQQTEMGGAEYPPATEPPATEPPATEPPVTEPPITEPPVTEPPVTEPPVTEPPVTELPSDVLIISDTRTISNQTIDTNIYITSTGVVTFTNVTVNGNVYCYGKLTVSGGSAHNLYAYYWDLGGITSSCKAWDGTHGLVKGAFRTCESVIIKDDALDYAFNKWGKR